MAWLSRSPIEFGLDDSETTDVGRGAPSRASTPSTVDTQYTGDFLIRKELLDARPSAEECRAAYQAVLIATVPATQVGRGEWRLSALGHCFIKWYSSLREVLWDWLGLNYIDDLENCLDCQLAIIPIAGNIMDRLLRIAIPVDLPEAGGAATGSRNNCQRIQSVPEDTGGSTNLRDAVRADYQELYLGSEQEYEDWLALKRPSKRKDNPNSVCSRVKRARRL